MTVAPFYVPALAFALTFGLTGIAIPVLRRRRVGQTVRADGPASHRVKAGTPAMGGAIFLPVAVGVTLAAAFRPDVALLAGVGLGYAALGFADDYLKAFRRRPLGLKARQKLVGQLVLALVAAWGARAMAADVSVLRLPGSVHGWSIGPYYWPLALLVVVGTANAVNLTDGVDGLAGGLGVVAFVFYAVVGHLLGQPSLSLLFLALAGSLLAFLLFNFHPARIFMGDTGSLGLGAILGAAAVLTRSELFLLLVGGVFVVETLSVMVQVAAFRLTGRRVLLMSPLHHHFELAGWSEGKLVRRFWGAGVLLAMAALWLWH